MAFNTTPVYAGAIAGADVGTPGLMNSLYVQRSVLASRPAVGNKGVFFFASDDANGERIFWDDGAAFVDLGLTVNGGAQSWAGVKTFSAIPVGPASDPTTDSQLARKAYVDNRHVFKRKTALEIVNNSATLQNDDHLFFSVGANEVWAVEVLLAVDGPTAADIKIGWTFPTGTLGSKWFLAPILALVDRVNTALNISATGSLSGSDNFGTLPSPDIATILLFTLFRIGGTAGTIQLQWAQIIATVGDTAVEADSFLIAHRLA